MNYDEKYDNILKIVFVGDSNVGKTNIITQYTMGNFNITTKPTIGVDFYTKIIKLYNTSFKCEVWDTSGQERYRSITPIYYKNAKIAIVVFDITKKNTLINTSFWLKELMDHCDKDIIIILVGNKKDLSHLRDVSEKEALDFVKKYNLSGYIEISALTRDNINDIFNISIKEFYLQITQQEHNIKNTSETSSDVPIKINSKLESLQKIFSSCWK